jgi:lysophospholipase L1-like esterase
VRLSLSRRRLVASAVAVAAAAGAAVAAPATAAPAPLRYVAMGDSYSAASGNIPPDPTAAPQCLRSTANYPHVLAKQIGAQLTDVTCGGAETKDYFQSQYQGVPPQLNALSSNTQLVTMTIGGNDSGVFINSIVDCGLAGLSTGGQGTPCKDKYGSQFTDTIKKTTYPSLVKALKAVRAKAPKARVAILGYPWIVPATAAEAKADNCFTKLPVAYGDVPYLRNEQAVLNDAVRRAAAATGATYVNMNQVSNHHDACKPIGVRWIEPVLQGTNPVIVHPNAFGESRMAAQTKKVLALG